MRFDIKRRRIHPAGGSKGIVQSWGIQWVDKHSHIDIASIVQHPKKVQRYKAYVNTEKCWGCLSCALVCEPKTITAHCARPVEWVPKYDDTATPTLRRTEGVRLVQAWD